MKSLIGKLIPGVVATLAAIALGVFAMAHAQNKPAAVESAAPAPAVAPLGYAMPAPSSGPLLVCGACGAQLNAPQTVNVLTPAGNWSGPRERREARESERVVYVDRDDAIQWAPAYYGQSNCAPAFNYFGAVRVNPIPFEPLGIAYANRGRSHRHN